VRTYLDYNATTPVDPRVRDAMAAALDRFGNPSSLHAEGRLARDAVEAARRAVGELYGGAASGVIFTSGGTEADVLAVTALARAARAAGRPARIVSSPLEHPAIQGALDALAADGFAIARVPVDGAGRIDPEEVRRALAGGAALATFALVNHEIGNVYDVARFAELAHAAGAFIHCDAVQAAGRLPIDVRALGVDALAISAHKIHGAKGTGAAWVRAGIEIAPFVSGGHQERGLRPGTENVAGIVGFGEAARIARAESVADALRIAALRDRLEAGLLAIAGARVHGDRAARVANTINVAFEGAAGELVVTSLDLEGVAASTGAACTSGSLAPSPVILALGQPRARALESVRLSLGRETTDADVDRVLAILPPIVARIRSVV
jgi:cysteine desulfurase